MTIALNNYEEMLDFISLDEISFKQACDIVSKMMTVIIVCIDTKEELIIKTKRFIERFGYAPLSERPLLLGLEEKEDFDITKVYNPNNIE